MNIQFFPPAALLLLLSFAAPVLGQPKEKEKLYLAPLRVEPRPIAQDASVKYDYDIVYVRAPRKGDDKGIAWTEVFSPLRGEPGSDLMLLHPDGKEEVLVAENEGLPTNA